MPFINIKRIVCSTIIMIMEQNMSDTDESLKDMDIGQFNVPLPDGLSFSDEDSFDELFSSNTVIEASDNASNIEIEKMLRDLRQSEDIQIPQPGLPAMPAPKPRFKSFSEEEIEEFTISAQAKSTQKNTLWGMKIFQDWSNEVYGHTTDMHDITAENLATKLKKFYCEATPRNVQKRNENLTEKQAEVYHKNTMINIRAAINRHLQDLKRDIDIVRDKQFKPANKTLDGLLKVRMTTGASRATKHKEVIPENDMKKISTYLQGSLNSPYILRQAVWFNLALHFVSRGLEFHKQLRLDSFAFSEDENGNFVTLRHLTHQKNHTGGISKSEDENTKKMYAVPSAGQFCPVSLLKLLIDKTDPSAEMLFNQYHKNALPNAVWYTKKPLAPRTFVGFMPEICKHSGVKKYTAHCLRATAITAMNDSGFEARHIMFMSGHRSEAAIRSYNRTCSNQQKKSLSNTLSCLASGETPQNSASNSEIVPRPRVLQPSHTVARNLDEVRPSTNLMPNVGALDENKAYSSSVMSNYTSTGMLTNSVFHGCTFNFSN
ncbi:uncharacterized protein [Argopecten irradians]|uniref:uncharacterized protein n=1 Tax=Argopecten irradians TaxID=31199 RepID=UPI00370FDDD9